MQLPPPPAGGYEGTEVDMDIEEGELPEGQRRQQQQQAQQQQQQGYPGYPMPPAADYYQQQADWQQQQQYAQAAYGQVRTLASCAVVRCSCTACTWSSLVMHSVLLW
jgi:hypothetical protein